MNRIHNEQTGYKWLNIRWHYPVCLFLAIATLAVYGQVKEFEFIDVDDPLYVTENRYVQQGLTVETVRWAFTDATRETNYWAPVTWLSILLDYELYGMNPGAFHLTNVLFHILNTLLLFFVLWRMTGRLWQSAFVAALFALHPLHVESVAWVTERKDVLSTFFWMLTMLAYGWYVQQPGCRRYVLVLLLFILGLMSKPMLVTLPFVLLLLDYWPLARYPGGGAKVSCVDTRYEKSPLYLLREKIPFVVLIVIMSIMTFLTQQEGGAVKSLSDFPMDVRIANALVTYVNYMIKMVWPSRLAFFYPHPGRLPFWQVSAATIFLALITVLSLKTRKRHPYAMVGWLWYLGTLVPLIGLVVIGPYVMADRYTYIPLIGLFMAIVWGVSAACVKWRCPPVVMALVGTGIIAFLAMGSFKQVTYWRNSQTLFRHTLSATEHNYLIHQSLADSLAQQGNLNDAIEHYRIALQIKPDFAEGHNNLGAALERSGDPFQAIEHYQEAIRCHPGYAPAENNMGTTFVHLGRTDQAIMHYTRSLLYDPDKPDTHNNLGMALLRVGKIDRAIHHFQQAVRLDPLGGIWHRNLTLTASYQKKIDGALKELSDVLYSNLEKIDRSGPIDLIVRKKTEFDHVVYQHIKALTPQPGFTPAEFNIDNYFAASEVITLYNRLLPLYQKISMLGPENPEADYYAACIYSVRNQPQEAVHLLDNAVKKGFNKFSLMAGDENLNNIRQTPYFKKLLQGKIR